jgi:uroporphyrinogen-III synthase
MSEDELPLAGRTVGVTAARRAEELTALLRRRGAEVRHAPAIRTVPLADDGELRAATARLLAAPPDVVLATTAVGFRGWLEAADGWGEGEALRAALASARLLIRGPKVKGAAHAAGLRAEFSPGSESTPELLEYLLARGVTGLRIAVQLHGDPLTGVLEALRAAGAEVEAVAVYRWLPPEDPGPLDALIEAVARRELDAVTFTSAPAARSLLARAQERGRRAELLAALRTDVRAVCVGPTTAAPLTAQDVPVLHPERFRLAPMVQTLCEAFTQHG